ncbi:MAG: hypothetical protein QOG96_3882 [Pseudonocardiales bacterium]|nr:hypothetical protein [Pseudonocardiales bacterium]
MPLTTTVDDQLAAHGPPGAAPGWFDRFYLNAHAGTGTPYLLVGAGVYPVEGRVDGYAVAVTDFEQINLRVADTAGGERPPPGGVGPLSWQVLDPLRAWRVRLAPNPSGLAFDLTWTARTAPWECRPITLDDGRGQVMVFDHAFQSGHHRGWLEVDGRRTEVTGWTGQRDRSRGRRMATARQGLHLWVQAQFADECVAFLYDLDRANRPTLLDGAVLGASGAVDQITAVGHELTFDDSLETTGGLLAVHTRGGRRFTLAVDAAASRGGFLGGAGYGGWHGADHGPGHLEHDRWDLRDPALVPRALHYPLTDRLAGFSLREDGHTGSGAGIFEFAHSRSPAYRYAPAPVES